jgi:hypothetical protein
VIAITIPATTNTTTKTCIQIQKRGTIRTVAGADGRSLGAPPAQGDPHEARTIVIV